LGLASGLRPTGSDFARRAGGIFTKMKPVFHLGENTLGGEGVSPRGVKPPLKRRFGLAQLGR